VYGDVGPLLARSLREHPRLRALPVRRPSETIRATVLGAASQTVTLSGSTIWAEPGLLPLFNLPVIEPALPEGVPAASDLAEALLRAVRRWDRAGDGRVALAIDLPPGLGYPALARLAEGVVAYTAADGPSDHPVVLVTERDYAQSLGQTIKGLAPSLPLVAIDQIGLGEGDFIDIGRPMLDGRVVPVSVKTLVFYE
jgi:ethanolamine utilization protein EutA